ncbi:MAG: PA2779 family protein [Aquabacterium sp.]
MTLNKKFTAWAVAIALSHSAGLQAAHAGLIATESVAAEASAAQSAAQVAERRAHVLATLNRADVAQALTERGVDMDAARARVDALSDQEVLALADQLDKAPAGASDVLGAILFVFILLLITDILGLTKVFPFTRSVR